MKVVSGQKMAFRSPSEIKSHLEKDRAKKLSKDNFPYHNWEKHILPAYEDVAELGRLAGLAQKEIDLLQIAVLYHDIALPEGRKGHEEGSAQIAEQSENLRKEMGIEDKRAWRELQIDFLTKHRFHTQEAEQLWGEQKKVNLENL